jgi:homospermidine synthase
VEGFISEGFQPAELGWGTHETWMPKNAKKHKKGCKAAIYLEQPGANTSVRTWCPTPGPQYGFLVTHNESISIADYLHRQEQGGEVKYRPTCHYAYHPANDAVLSLHEMFGNGGNAQPSCMCSTKTSWSRASMSSACCSMAMRRTPTGSARAFRTRKPAARALPERHRPSGDIGRAGRHGLGAGKPNAGIVEADEMDYKRCLEVQSPYLGPVEGHYTDWTPLDGRPGLFPEDIDKSDPWQFRNVLVR